MNLRFWKKSGMNSPGSDFVAPPGGRTSVAGDRKGTREMASLLTLFGFVFVLSVLILFYMRMRIEVSLLDRRIKQTRVEKLEQERKNASLRAELARKRGQDAVLTYWKLYGALPDYEKNQLLRIRLP